MNGAIREQIIVAVGEENDAVLQQLIASDLAELDAVEVKHLEEEFDDYEELHAPGNRDILPKRI